MSKKTRLILLSITALIVLFAGSYFNFASYRPKVIKQVEDVKGLMAESVGDLPLPQGAEKIGVNRSSDSTQTTFHVNKDKAEVQEFYKNIFVSTKWHIESQGVHNDFIIYKYQKNNDVINVITMDSNDDYKTLVSIETSKL